VPQAPWDVATEVAVDLSLSGGDTVSVSKSSKVTGNLVDLEPGTPYCVRFVISGPNGKKFGPETIFDTKPIGCAPKKEKKKSSCSLQ
jgi:hypothetical protein